MIVLLLTSIICSYIGINKYIEYNGKKTEKNNIEKIENEIKEVEVKISEKKEEVNKAKEDNKEILKEVEIWQEKVKKVKSYLS